MDSKERTSFEEELEESVTLKKQLEEVKSLIHGVEAAVTKEKLNRFHQEIDNDSHAKPKASRLRHLNFKKYVMAASVALLIGITGFWYSTSKDPNQEFFNEYFIPDPGLPTTMSSNSNYEFYEAMVSYKQAKYSLAISQWNTLLEQKPENDTLNYFLGVAHLASNNEDLAIDLLSKVCQQSNSYFIDDAFYYLGLAQLKAGNVEAAKYNLDKSDHKKAALILSEIKQ